MVCLIKGEAPSLIESSSRRTASASSSNHCCMPRLVQITKELLISWEIIGAMPAQMVIPVSPYPLKELPPTKHARRWTGGVAFREHPRDEYVVKGSAQTGLRRAPNRPSLNDNVDQHLTHPIHERVSNHIPGFDMTGSDGGVMMPVIGNAADEDHLVHRPMHKEENEVV